MKIRDNKKALVTGITGQDGPYLAELLLEKGYEVHAIRRRGATDNTGRIKDIMNHPNFWLHYGDMTDGSTLDKLVSMVKPDEVYNLAAMSHVRISFDIPVYTFIEAVFYIGCWLPFQNCFCFIYVSPSGFDIEGIFRQILYHCFFASDFFYY